MHFITGGLPIPPDRIREIADRTLRMWDEHGFGPWAAVERSTGRWVGRIGLNLLHDWPEPDKWEIGFELSPEFWGQGLATEGARESLRFGFDDVGLRRIISVTRVDHAASRRVMEKCGLTFQAELDWRGAQVAWYASDRANHEAGEIRS